MFHSTEKKFALGAAVLACVLLVAQHWGMALSNSDDPWITQLGWSGAIETAKAQGRFWLVPINLLAQLPYLAGSWPVANATKMVVNALVLFTFVLFCARLWGLKMGLFVGLVWLALIDVAPGYYSPFHGFLLMFNLQYAALFYSFALYIAHLKSPDPTKSSPWSAFLWYGFALLAYEPMLFYAAAFPAMFLYIRGPEDTEKSALRSWARTLLSYARRDYGLALVIVAYFIAYFGFRWLLQTPGRGIDSGGEWWAIWKTVYRFSMAGLHAELNPLVNYLSGSTSLLSIALAVAYALAIATGLFFLVPQLKSPRAAHSPWMWGVLLFYVFSPNLLHGFVESYRQWAADDPHYVGNYMSSFPLAMLVALGCVHIVGGTLARQERVLFLAVIYLFASSACDNHLRWVSLAAANRHDSQLWGSAITELKSRPTIVAASEVVCAEHWPERVSGDDRYWSAYVSRELGRPVTIKSKNLAGVSCGQRLDFNQWRFSRAP